MNLFRGPRRWAPPVSMVRISFHVSLSCSRAKASRRGNEMLPSLQLQEPR